ncbi:universal stress protein [Halomonas sp. A40-4]|jgi:nucleotide-binding universal stress UspA family protein|uniref:universal stress protein n=1 Tax=Halomonas sp. A40-4 TaxID=2785909 RepID=UPI0018EF51B3|nr:universal stress protein [Halomonas sp. A40-4]QPL46065.1 universal stress protein [Halomonas sp. A40-4]
MYDRILVPIDGSEHAKQALSVACKLLGESGATLYLLHIPQVLAYEATLVWGVGALNAEAPLDERIKAGDQLLEQALASACEQGAQQVEKHLIQGDPVRVILETANNLPIDAIVMGSRGLSDLGGVMIGSVSHKVSHSAKCRVITVSR